MKTTTLLIARHGSNFERGDTILRLGAKSDLPLSKTGLRQGQALGRYLLKHHLVPQQIFTSELARTMQMGEQVQKALGAKIPTEALANFNEIDHGPDENQPEDKVLRRIGKPALKAWDESGLPPIGWHVDAIGLRAAWYDLGARVANEFEGQTVLVITHGGVARFASVLTGDTHGLDKHISTAQGAKLAPGAFGRFVHKAPHWECLTWNVKPPLSAVKTSKSAAKKTS